MPEDKPDLQTQIATSIASAGTDSYKSVEVADKVATETAPAEGNQEQVDIPAPTDGQPEDASKVQEKPIEKVEPVATDGQPETVQPVEKTETVTVGEKGKPEQTEEALLREALGLPSAEPETIETLRASKEASSREAHRLVEEQKAKDSALREAGVEFTRTADGRFALKANEKYLDSLKDTDLPNIYAKLSEDDKGLVAEDVAKKIVKMALSEVLPKRPIAKATGEDAILAPEQVDKAFNDLIGQKLSNGQPRFADMSETTTQKFMRELYDHPSRAGLRQWMNQSSDNFKEGLSLLHASVFRVRAPLLAMKKDAEAAKKQEQEKLKKKPATVTSGTGITSDAMRHRGSRTGNDAAAIALKIASAKAA